MSKIIYLGYLDNKKGDHPNLFNIQAVVNYLIPKNVNEVHRFVELMSFFVALYKIIQFWLSHCMQNTEYY